MLKVASESSFFDGKYIIVYEFTHESRVTHESILSS